MGMVDFEGTIRLPSIDPMLWNVSGNVRLNLAAIYLGAKLFMHDVLMLTVSRISYSSFNHLQFKEPIVFGVFPYRHRHLRLQNFRLLDNELILFLHTPLLF